MRVLQFSLSVIFRRDRRQNRHIHDTTHVDTTVYPPAPPLLQNSNWVRHNTRGHYSLPTRPSPPPKLYTGYHTVSFTMELPCTSVMVPGKPSCGAIWTLPCTLKRSRRTLLRRISKCTPWGIILTLHAISAPGAQLLTFTKYFCAGTTTYTVTQYSADVGGA